MLAALRVAAQLAPLVPSVVEAVSGLVRLLAGHDPRAQRAALDQAYAAVEAELARHLRGKR